MSHYTLDLDPNRPVALPKDAATIVVVRDGVADDGSTQLEIFGVERHQGSRFFGGALVFPGGKLDPGDQSDIWTKLGTPPLPWPDSAADVADETGETDAKGAADRARALAVCACRETLEEAALLLADAEIGDADVTALRLKALENPQAIEEFLRARNVRLALDRLIPFSRWITPVAEPRRYDTRFFLAPAPKGQVGAHDERETTASFWATPQTLLELNDAEKIFLAPPTNRTISILLDAKNVAEAEAIARQAILEPICPELVIKGETTALCLPGDPEHSVRDKRIAGSTRFVKHGTRWLPY